MTLDEEKAIRARIPLRLSDASDVSVALEHLDWLRAEHARVSEQADAKNDLRAELHKMDLQVREVETHIKATRRERDDALRLNDRMKKIVEWAVSWQDNGYGGYELDGLRVAVQEYTATEKPKCDHKGKASYLNFCPDCGEDVGVDAEKRVGPQQKECCCQAMGGGLMRHCPGCPKHNENPIHEDDHQ